MKTLFISIEHLMLFVLKREQVRKLYSSMAECSLSMSFALREEKKNILYHFGGAWMIFSIFVHVP